MQKETWVESFAKCNDRDRKYVCRSEAVVPAVEIRESDFCSGPGCKYKLRHKCQMDTIPHSARAFRRFKWPFSSGSGYMFYKYASIGGESVTISEVYRGITNRLYFLYRRAFNKSMKY